MVDKKKFNSITFLNDSNFSEARQKAILTTERKKLLLGREAHMKNRNMIFGNLVFHEPSPYPSNTESIYIKGPTGSGKSYIAFALALQSFFSEGRTWIIIDTKKSYIGNNRSNYSFIKDIMAMGLKPRGIPSAQMDIISPFYYNQMVDPQLVRNAHIQHSYKIPLGLCSLQTMMEITRMNANTQYAATFDNTFKQLIKEKGRTVTINDFRTQFNRIAQNPHLPAKNMFLTISDKLNEYGKLMIDEGVAWSSFGECLMKAATERRPRWIVFTLCLGDRAEEPMNLALVTAIITELKIFARMAKDKQLPIKLGIMIDELYAFTRDKTASTRFAIHDLLMQWGRTFKILRIFLTQRDEQLDSVFRDVIYLNKHTLKSSGAYQTVIECRNNPDPGFASYLNRSTANITNPDLPTFYPRIKLCPPIAEVESEIINDDDWKRIQKDKYFNNKKEDTD